MNSEKEIWNKIELFFKENFTDGEAIDLDGMLFLIGIQELGKGNLNLIHIAVCKLLEPFGFYRFDGFDADGWQIYENIKPLPDLKSNEQTLLMKKAIVHYFEQEELI